MMLKHALAWAAVASLVACGGAPVPPPFTPAGVCQAPGLGAIYTQDVRPCGCVIQAAQQARSALLGAGLARLDDDFTRLDLYVRASNNLWTEDGTEFGGKFIPQGSYAEVTRSGGELVHEMLHYLQVELRGIDPGISGRHVGWVTNGYDSASVAFVQKTDPLSVPYTGTPCVE